MRAAKNLGRDVNNPRRLAEELINLVCLPRKLGGRHIIINFTKETSAIDFDPYPYLEIPPSVVGVVATGISYTVKWIVVSSGIIFIALLLILYFFRSEIASQIASRARQASRTGRHAAFSMRTTRSGEVKSKGHRIFRLSTRRRS